MQVLAMGSGMETETKMAGGPLQTVLDDIRRISRTWYGRKLPRDGILWLESFFSSRFPFDTIPAPSVMDCVDEERLRISWEFGQDIITLVECDGEKVGKRITVGERSAEAVFNLAGKCIESLAIHSPDSKDLRVSGCIKPSLLFGQIRGLALEDEAEFRVKDSWWECRHCDLEVTGLH